MERVEVRVKDLERVVKAVVKDVMVEIIDNEIMSFMWNDICSGFQVTGIDVGSQVVR